MGEAEMGLTLIVHRPHVSGICKVPLLQIDKEGLGLPMQIES